jgi:hypothetical protein
MSGGDDMAIRTTESINISVHVADKVFSVATGDGSQRVKWLGHVGIARWDEENLQGWKYWGVPVSIEAVDSGQMIDMGAIIKDVLRTGDHVRVKGSLNPAETK